jgi:hypothetical protein
MTDKTTDTTGVTFEKIDFEDLPEELQNMIKNAVGSDMPTGLHLAAESYSRMTHEVFVSMVLCTCVAHNRMKDVDKIRSILASAMASFSSDQASPLFYNPSQDALDKGLMNVMLKSRALAEDALDVKRHDGTAKGEECHLL